MSEYTTIECLMIHLEGKNAGSTKTERQIASFFLFFFFRGAGGMGAPINGELIPITGLE